MAKSKPKRTTEEALMGLGDRSMDWLSEVGLDSREKLEEAGPAEAFRRVKERHPEVNSSLLWALAGALLELDWRELPQDLKQHLLFEVEAAQKRAAVRIAPVKPPEETPG